MADAVVRPHYNGAGSSVLIAGLFHSMHNAIVNSTGLAAVVGLPQFEVLVIMAGIVVFAAVVIAVATRGRLGLSDHQDLAPEFIRHRLAELTLLTGGKFAPQSAPCRHIL